MIEKLPEKRHHQEATLLYNDYTITIATRQGLGYPVSALAEGMGRTADVLHPPPANLLTLIAQVDQSPPGVAQGELLTTTGVSLFRWLMERLEMHWRVAADRAERQGRGLRLRLSIDAPEINAWPWELLHDPQRDRTFATSIASPLVRYLDQTDQFGGLSDLKADLPLKILLVLPNAPGLNLVKERAVIEQALVPLDHALKLDVLDGIVTRTRFANALVGGDYVIIHGSGHGSFLDGQGYIALNLPDGAPDWVDGQVMGRFVVNCKSLKLGVLNVCSSGKVSDGRGFQGLAPQLVRAGVPAVVAMQYPLADDAAMAFADEFYRRLCAGEHAGRVDVAVTYARNMLAILYPGDLCFAAPVVYTHAPDGVIFAVHTNAATAPAPIQRKNGALSESLRASATLEDTLAWTDHQLLESWRLTLTEAADAYRQHLTDPTLAIQDAAHQGLALISQRLKLVNTRLNEDRAN